MPGTLGLGFLGWLADFFLLPVLIKQSRPQTTESVAKPV